MKVYFAIKFHEDCRNKNLIEQIADCLSKAGIDSVVMARDFEYWDKIKFTPEELMKLTFKVIDDCDALVIEFSEKGVGLGIEAGYAYAKNKPIIVIAKRGSDISSTIVGIAERVIFYDSVEELTEKFKNLSL